VFGFFTYWNAPNEYTFRNAEKAGARYAVFVGESELARGLYGMKDLATGEQVDRDEAGIVSEASR